MRLFAYDACLSYQHSDPEHLNELINKELGKVDRWLHANKFFINFSKTKFLLINKTSKNVNLVLRLRVFLLSRVLA